MEKLVAIRLYIFYITHTPAYLRQLSTLNLVTSETSRFQMCGGNGATKCSSGSGSCQHYCTKKRATHGSHTLPHTHTATHTLTPIWLHATRLLHFKVNALYMQQQQQSCIALCCVSVWTVRQTNAAVSQVPTCHLPLYPAAAVWPKSLWWNIFALHYATIYDF